MSEIESCSNCKFGKKETGDDEQRTCKRYPPVFDRTYVDIYCEDEQITQCGSDSAIWWGFPVVFSDNWCGEYKNAI